MTAVTAVTTGSEEVQATPRNGRFGRGLVVLVLVGAVARLAFALLLAPDLELSGDAVVYREMGAHLAAGDGLSFGVGADGEPERTAEHPPVFPSLLGGLDLVGLGSVGAQRVALALGSTTAVLLVGLIGRHVAGLLAGLLAAGVAALHPLWVQPSGVVMSESLYLVMVPAVVWLSLRFDGSRRGAVLLGSLVGVTALIRPEGAGLLVLVVLPCIIRSSPSGSRLRNAVAALALCAVVVLPWLVRNELQVGAPVISTNPGKTITGSNCDDTYAGPGVGSFSYDCLFSVAAVILDEADADGVELTARELDDEMGRIGRTYVREHLDEVPRVVASRIARLWGVGHLDHQLEFDVGEGRHRGLQRLGQWVNVGLLPLAGIGGALLLRRRGAWPFLVVVGPAALVTVATVLIYGTTRFRAAGELTLAVLAAVTVSAAVGLALDHRRGRPSRTLL